MQTFIVRLYRDGIAPLGEVAGTVEQVDSGERTAFANPQELLERLLHGALLAPEPAQDSGGAESAGAGTRGTP